jgi:hypothetical protein
MPLTLNQLSCRLQDLMQNGYSRLLLFTFTLSFLVWFTPFCFLWRDDWWYIQFYIEKNYSFISGVFNADIKPLYKYFYFAELFLFGKHFILYLITSIFLFSLWVSTSLSIFSNFIKDRKLHVLFLLILLFNPTNFVNIYWIFSQCELLHLLFVNLYLLAIIVYVKSSKNKFAFLAMLCLAIQHLVFPNGFFYPILGVIYVLLFSKRKWYCLFNVLSILLILSFYFYAKFLSVSNMLSFQVILSGSFYLITYIASTCFRLFLVESRSLPAILTVALTVILLASFAFAFYRADMTRKKIYIFFVAWVLIASFTIGIFRHDNTGILFYHTSLNILPVLIALFCILEPYTAFFKSLFSKIYKPCIILYFVFAFVELNYGKYIFSRRSIENYKTLQYAINSNTTFTGYDEPFASTTAIFLKYKNKQGGDALKNIYLDFK